MMWSQRLFAALAGLVLGLLVTGVPAAAPARAEAVAARLPGHEAALYRRALAEGGRLLVYGGGDLPNQLQWVEQAFEAAYPGIDLIITVNFSKVLDARIDTQLERGQLEPDLAQLQTLHDFEHWKRQGVLLPYRPAGSEHVPARFKDAEGYYTGLYVLAFAHVYNTAALTPAQAPRDYLDYLEPRYKDQLVFTYPNDDDGVLYAFWLAVRKHGWGYLDRLMAQNPRFVRGVPTAGDAVAQGRALATFAAWGPLQPAADAPARMVLPRSDGLVAWAQTAAIFKAARHPAAAKLYMNWFLSRPTQERLPQWPVRGDVAPPPGHAPVTQYLDAGNTDFRAFMADRAALERFRAQIEQVVGPVQGRSPLHP